MGNALVDTGSQVTLEAERVLNERSRIKPLLLKIHGNTGDAMETIGQVNLCTGDTLPHEFLMVKSLPMNYDVLLGQDLLERFVYYFHMPSLGITLPAYSETVVRIPTTDRGIRLVEAQELQENVFCASSVVECKDSTFLCLVLNLNSTDETLKKFPRTQGLPKLTGKFQGATHTSSHARN